MSSWQQALSEDIRKGKKRDNVVVMNRNQEKNLRTGREDPDCANWLCTRCDHKMLGSYYRCEKCGCLRPDERKNRLEMRAKDGEIGRGGGFFQRPSASDRKEWNSDDEGIDEFGRKKRKAVTASGRRGAAGNASGGPAVAGQRREARGGDACGSGNGSTKQALHEELRGAARGTGDAPQSRSRSLSKSRSPSRRSQ
mmetsp:Transcript_21395/g.47414  ORF Transcript_21395/g.47414 Transcript_21395/m.47414 type:complete len:196 (+) Transcript_21395:97-684(+)